MKAKQVCAAMLALLQWLAHPSELGYVPADMRYVGEFEMNGLTYFMFQFRPQLDDAWLLGVCGGYEADELTHCGHVWSKFEPYNETTAEAECRHMVEGVISYWKARAEQEAKKK